MTQSAEQLTEYPDTCTETLLRVNLFSVGVGAMALLLALGLSGVTVELPRAFASDSISSLWPGTSLPLFIFLYGILATFAYPTHHRLVLGMTTAASIAAYLTHGSSGVLIVIVAGELLGEVGRELTYRVAHFPVPKLRDRFSVLLFHISAGLLAVLAGGALYYLFGGKLALTTLGPALRPPLPALVVTSLLIYELLTAFRLALLPKQPPRRIFIELLLAVCLTHILTALSVVLLPVTYYSFPVGFFAVVYGGTIIIAILWYGSMRWYTLSQRHQIALETFEQIGLSLAGAVSVDDLLARLHQQVAQRMEVQQFYVALAVPETHSVSFPYVSHNGVRLTWHGRQHVNGISEYIIRTVQPLVVNGSLRARARQLQIEVVESEARSFVGMPIQNESEVIGVLCVQHSHCEAYSAAGIDLLRVAARQAALALRNASLYDRVIAMANEMAVVNKVSSLVSATLDLNAVLQTTCQVVTELSEAEKTAVFLINEDGRSVSLVHGLGLSEDFMAQFHYIRIDSESGPAQALRQNEVMAISNVMADARALGWRSLAEVEGYTGLLTVPLVANHRTIGLLAAFYTNPHVFPKNELELVHTLANQVSVTVANARLYRQTDQALAARVEELTAIEAISLKISASLDLEEIIDYVLDSALTVTKADLAGFGLVVNEGIYRYIERYPKGSGVLPIDQLLKLVPSVTNTVLQTGHLKRVDDVKQEPLFRTVTLNNMQSELCVPLLQEGKAMGALNLESRRLAAFTTEHERFMVGLAGHVAVALANVRLFEERQAQIDTLLQFRNLSLQLLMDSTLKQTMSHIVGYALVITRAKDVHLYLYDRSSDTLTFGASLWVDGRVDIEASTPDRNGSTYQVARTGRIHLIEDVTKLADPPTFRYTPGFSAIARIPLKRGRETIGVLNLAYRESHKFTDHELRAMDLLAGQAAIALENARLFDEVRLSRDQMQTVFTSTREGLVLLGTRGEILLTNPPAEQMVGYSISNFTGKHIVSTVVRVAHEALHPDHVQDLLEVTRHLVRDVTRADKATPKYVFQLEVEGQKRDIEVSALPVRNWLQEQTGWLVVLRDVSEEEASKRFRDDLTNMVVHDLRSPLSSVVSSLNLLKDMADTQDFAGVDEVIDLAFNNVQNQMKMVESILEFNKLEHGQLKLLLSAQPLNPLVESVNSALDLAASSVEVVLHNNVSDNLPPVQIDEDVIRRVLVNLVDNAIRHTPEHGHIRIEAAPVDDQPFIRVVVQDTGKGVSPDFQTKLFQKFVTIPKSALRGRRGIGLGLAFCKLAVEAHGGKIWVENAPEGGAAFMFTLPIAEQQAVFNS